MVFIHQIHSLSNFSPIKSEKEKSSTHKTTHFLPPADAGAEAGSVLDDHEGPAEHHHLHVGCPGQPHLPAHHRHLHLRRSGHAALRQDVHRGKLLPGSSAQVRSITIDSCHQLINFQIFSFPSQMEFHRLLPLLHDDFSHSLWGMD